MQYPQEIIKLTEASPFFERVMPLLEKPELGEEVLGMGPNEPIKSNCCGTLVHAIGAGRILHDQWNELLRQGMTPGTDSDYVWLPEERPGYVGQLPMEEFLWRNARIHETEQAPHTMVSFWWQHIENADAEPRLQHVGLYLGQAGNQQAMFHQRNKGKKFGWADINGYVERARYKAEDRKVITRFYALL